MNFFAFGSEMAKGRQARNAIDSQRDIEQFNIKVEKQNAMLVGQQASAREEQQRRESRQLLGTQRAAIGQSNVGFEGSSADIIRQSASSAELDALNVRYAGVLERSSILNSISMREYNDKLLKVQGKQAMRMRWLNALSGLVGGSSTGESFNKALGRENTAYGNQGTSHKWASGAGGAYGGFGKSGTGPD